MSSSLTDKVIEVACRNLRTMGCKYIVIKPDGNQLIEGELALAEAKKKRTHTKVNSFVGTGYRDVICAMEPGDRWTFQCEGDYKPEAYQKVISAKASAEFGTGNFQTMQHENSVELVRLA